MLRNLDHLSISLRRLYKSSIIQIFGLGILSFPSRPNKTARKGVYATTNFTVRNILPFPRQGSFQLINTLVFFRVDLALQYGPY